MGCPSSPCTARVSPGQHTFGLYGRHKRIPIPQPFKSVGFAKGPTIQPSLKTLQGRVDGHYFGTGHLPHTKRTSTCCICTMGYQRLPTFQDSLRSQTLRIVFMALPPLYIGSSAENDSAKACTTSCQVTLDPPGSGLYFSALHVSIFR